MKHLKIDVSPDGSIKFDLEGYTNNACEKDLQELSSGMSTSSKKRKPEYYNKEVAKVKVAK